MSSKKTLFLTSDNEHFFEDMSLPHRDNSGNFIGNSLILEISKENIEILSNNESDLIIEFKNPKSDIYKNSLKMKE